MIMRGRGRLRLFSYQVAESGSQDVGGLGCDNNNTH